VRIPVEADRRDYTSAVLGISTRPYPNGLAIDFSDTDGVDDGRFTVASVAKHGLKEYLFVRPSTLFVTNGGTRNQCYCTRGINRTEKLLYDYVSMFLCFRETKRRDERESRSTCWPPPLVSDNRDAVSNKKIIAVHCRFVSTVTRTPGDASVVNAFIVRTAVTP